MVRLLTYEEYSKIKGTVPYVYELKKGKKKLLYLGSEHSNNSRNKQFSLFKKKFLAFKPDLVLLEGGEWDEYKNQKDAISHGEMAFLKHLAKKNGILTESAEMSGHDQILSLEKKFSRDELFAHFILRTIPQYVWAKKPSYWFDREFKWFRKETGWKKYSFTMTNLEKVHKRLFGEDIDYKDLERYKFSPVEKEIVCNKVANALGVVRDQYVIKRIKQSLKKHDRVLIIMGEGHAVIQEPVLREYFKKIA